MAKKKEPRYGVNCAGCVHTNTEWCDRCKTPLTFGRPTCYLHCSESVMIIKPITSFCENCTNDEKCRSDAGFRGECIYNGTLVPSQYKPIGVLESMEQNKKTTPHADGKSIKMITQWCTTCTNRKTCAIDEGFRDDCRYDGTSIPTLWEPDKTVKPEEKPSLRVEIFREITEKMADLYAEKNHDYGNSFLFTRERYPNAILIRLFDKLNRLDTLIGGESAKVAESIEDTLVDLANYAVMELVERRMEGQEK